MHQSVSMPHCRAAAMMWFQHGCLYLGTCICFAAGGEVMCWPA